MSEIFSGECIGGPQKGLMMAHWSKSKKFYRPMMAMPLPGFSQNQTIEAVEIGEYRLNDFGQWHWFATDAGRAYDKLFRVGQ